MDLVEWVYVVSLVLYCICIVLTILEWSTWSDGFKEQNGKFTSKYYAISYFIMKLGMIVMYGVLGYLLYILPGLMKLF